jgi:hypothetical protein
VVSTTSGLFSLVSTDSIVEFEKQLHLPEFRFGSRDCLLRLVQLDRAGYSALFLNAEIESPKIRLNEPESDHTSTIFFADFSKL